MEPKVNLNKNTNMKAPKTISAKLFLISTNTTLMIF
jgi:hypothetical protein